MPNSMEKFRKILHNFTSADLLACIIIIAGAILKAKHIDGIVDASIIAIVSFYFGQKIRSLTK
jgi:hypothetical protein